MLKSWVVAHEILEAAQSPKSPFPFWIWGWNFGLELGPGLVNMVGINVCNSIDNVIKITNYPKRSSSIPYIIRLLYCFSELSQGQQTMLKLQHIFGLILFFLFVYLFGYGSFCKYIRRNTIVIKTVKKTSDIPAPAITLVPKMWKDELGIEVV